MTVEQFREDAYLKSCDALVERIEENAIVLNQTVFYAEGGGQPGDRGVLRCANGPTIEVLETHRGANGSIRHVVNDIEHVSPGDHLSAAIDWDYRYRHMRMHTCLHLLCALIPHPVTGGSISQDKGRLDFDMTDSVDKSAIEVQLNALINGDYPVSHRFISETEMQQNMALVRTMSVAPPTGQGRVRLVDIETVDLQPCGGTHVLRTGEIGNVRVGKVEKKGRHNRRVNLHLA